ncbi:hypothetical protein [Thermobacillus composti]|uniref:hypothetical protein n=1 Tax=Thermobacillus composti TaxID=377615 RepID=UPI00022C3593|nr:hypothetical protein [Thermobacillus composti]
MKANKGSAGIDRITIQYIREEVGEKRFIKETCGQLKNGTYRPSPVRRVEIPCGYLGNRGVHVAGPYFGTKARVDIADGPIYIVKVYKF